MKQRKIIIIRGLVTSGKTTTSHELAKILPDYIFIDVWKIKEMFEPLNLKDRTPLKEASKKAMITIMKEVMTSLKTSIIVQETSRTYLMKYLKRYIKREKPTMFTKGLSEETWKENRVKPAKKDIIINTSKNSINQVIKIILKGTGEKAKKHPRADIIRK